MLTAGVERPVRGNVVDRQQRAARNGTFIVFNEIPQQNCFLGNEPFWLVEGITAAGFFSQKRREAAHAAIGKAFLSASATMARRSR